MDGPRLSLRWLEAFQAVATLGSVREGAASLGLSVSTVSQHITCLERTVGARLLDHDRRPMPLTPEGEVLLAHVDEALLLLRKGLTGLRAEDLASFMRMVRIAAIEDFDADVSPALVGHLARALPACEVSHLSRPSHEIVNLLQGGQVDLGIAASADLDSSGLVEEPLLRDPFVLVVPASAAETPQAFLTGATDLAFLRYSRKQMIGRRVDAQLRRLGIRLPGRIEFESTAAILAMIAAGEAWTITTALNVARTGAAAGRVRVAPFPGRAFSRRISIFRREDLPERIHAAVAAELRASLEALVIGPAVAAVPWLAGEFRLIPPATASGSGTPT